MKNIRLRLNSLFSTKISKLARNKPKKLDVESQVNLLKVLYNTINDSTIASIVIQLRANVPENLKPVFERMANASISGGIVTEGMRGFIQEDLVEALIISEKRDELISGLAYAIEELERKKESLIGNAFAACAYPLVIFTVALIFHEFGVSSVSESMSEQAKSIFRGELSIARQVNSVVQILIPMLIIGFIALLVFYSLLARKWKSSSRRVVRNWFPAKVYDLYLELKYWKLVNLFSKFGMPSHEICNLTCLVFKDNPYALTYLRRVKQMVIQGATISRSLGYLNFVDKRTAALFSSMNSISETNVLRASVICYESSNLAFKSIVRRSKIVAMTALYSGSFLLFAVSAPIYLSVMFVGRSF